MQYVWSGLRMLMIIIFLVSVGRARGLKIKGKNGESLLIVLYNFLVFSPMKPWSSVFCLTIQNQWAWQFKNLTKIFSPNLTVQAPMMFMQQLSWERRDSRHQFKRSVKHLPGTRNVFCKFILNHDLNVCQLKKKL